MVQMPVIPAVPVGCDADRQPGVRGGIRVARQAVTTIRSAGARF